MSRLPLGSLLTLAALSGCLGGGSQVTPARVVQGPIARYEPPPAAEGAPIEERLAQYTTVRLTSDLSVLSERERRMIPLLVDAARAMDELFWVQAYGNRDSLLASIADPRVRRFVEINYGPWDRLEADEPFVPGVGPKPAGANLYPADMTKEEFEREVAEGGERAEALRGLYTLVRRDAAGELIAVPYHEAFRPQLELATAKLREAAALAEAPGLKRYLELRADALLTDDFRPSDLAWMEMKDNTLEVVIGPIETYEDLLFGYKTAYEAYILLKDREWSERLERYVALLPALQRGLPVPGELKSETPGLESDLNAYDALYYAGQANAGPKTIAINLPNDEVVQLEKGTRRLQLKNSMQAKFDRILLPIARALIVPEQLDDITFDAFFENTMFHEVAHGLGIKNTINGRGTVREALRERAGGLEEEKADVLGLYMVTQLTGMGELPEEELVDNYTTFLAGLFRSVRFGATSAHGQANMATFNFFEEMGAFSRDEASGRYRIDFERMKEAVNALSERILRLQATGDYAGVGEFMERYGTVEPTLQRDLEKLSDAGIPVDIVFEQGMSVLRP